MYEDPFGLFRPRRERRQRGDARRGAAPHARPERETPRDDAPEVAPRGAQAPRWHRRPALSPFESAPTPHVRAGAPPVRPEEAPFEARERAHPGAPTPAQPTRGVDSERRRDVLGRREEEAVDWEARYRALSVDYERLRGRIDEERDQAAREALLKTLRTWLEVADSVERAREALPGASGAWGEGLEAIARQVKVTLKRMGVERIDPVGEPFDPQRHEALGVVPAPGVARGVVVHTQRAGHALIGGALVRPAQVIVAAGD